jgi:protein-S-isoprenylcysteine O-methyltransferase Ste14
MRFGLMGWLWRLAWIMAILYASIPSYWLVVHPFTGYWRSRQRSPFHALGLAWIAMWIALAVITWPWHSQRFYQTPFAWIASLILFALGFSIYRRIRSDFGIANLVGRTQLRTEPAEQRLVTTGMHARVRHPIYLAHLCILLGWTVGSGLLVDYALLIFALVTGAVMIWMEERELEGRFGEQFQNYRMRVPAMLPLRVKRAGR